MSASRILVLGGPASGKTTLARTLAAERGLPLVSLDSLFWHDSAETYDIRRDPAERDRMLAEAVAQEAWVMEGVYWKWTGPVFERAEQVVFVDAPLWLRHWRLAKRHVKRRLGLESSTHKETFEGAWQTARWNQRWDRDNRLAVLEILERYREKAEVR